MRDYLIFWKHIFDYRGRSTRKEYAVPLIVTVLLAVATVLLMCNPSGEITVGLIAGCVTGVLFLAHIIPMTSLTVRRMRDAGKRGWLYIPLILTGIGAVIVIVLCLMTAPERGIYSAIYNITVNAYGPPPDDMMNEWMG